MPSPAAGALTSPLAGPRTSSLDTSQKRKREEQPAIHRRPKSVCVDLTVPKYEPTGDNLLGTFRKSLQHLQGSPGIESCRRLNLCNGEDCIESRVSFVWLQRISRVAMTLRNQTSSLEIAIKPSRLT